MAAFVHVFCRRGSLIGKSLAYIDPAPLPMPQRLRLGRDPESNLQFSGNDELMVSGHHAELRLEGGDAYITDLGSAGGLFLLPTQERISCLQVRSNSQVEVQLGINGPVCVISVGVAVPFAHYWLTAKLGAGGMGEVYLAWDARLERFVVLKLIRPDFSSSVAAADQHLFDEARVVAKLENHHVVRIYELGEVGQVPYLAMEYLRGVSVNALHRKLVHLEMRLPAAVAAGIMRQVCLGLHAAHELPTAIVHRDISANNILITADSVKVIDFGLARAKNRICKSFTEENRIAGCPPYMSPEQIKTPQSVDRRSDIFSAAVVLYELCSGQGLFHRDNAMATLAAVLNSSPPPLRQVCPDASLELEQLVESALAKDPAERPATAGEFAARLRAAAGTQFSTHENLVEYLERLGIELHGQAPLPLQDEPELVRQTRIKVERGRPQESANLLLAPIELGSRVIAGGKYRLLRELGGSRPRVPARRWKRHSLAETTSAAASKIVIAMCGGSHHQHALAETDLAAFYRYIARRCQSDLSIGIPPVFDHGTAWPQGPSFFAMPYYPYRLNDLLATGLPKAQDAQRIAMQLALTLVRLTELDSDFVHGDISPSNIAIVQTASDSRQAILLNFSLSSALNRASGPEPPGFASSFAAPEPCAPGTTTPAGDVFSLAMTLYQMLGGNAAAAMGRIQEDREPPPLPAQAQAVVPAAVQNALFAALSADPEARPSAKEFHAELCPERSQVAMTSSIGQDAESDVVALPLPLKESCAEISSPLVGQLCVTNIEIDAHAQRGPVPLPLDLGGLLENCRHPLQLALANQLLELRVVPTALSAGRTVRIYDSVLTSTGARSSYAIPDSCSARRLFIGHHRGQPHLITVASSPLRSSSGAASMLLPELGVRLLLTKPLRRVVAIYRTEPQRSVGHLVCISI